MVCQNHNLISVGYKQRIVAQYEPFHTIGCEAHETAVEVLPSCRIHDDYAEFKHPGSKLGLLYLRLDLFWIARISQKTDCLCCGQEFAQQLNSFWNDLVAQHR